MFTKSVIVGQFLLIRLIWPTQAIKPYTVKARYNELIGSYKNMFVIDQVRYIEW